MKALILGTDLLKDSNGTLKIIETNTNVDVHNDIVPNLDWSLFKQFLIDNSITTLHFIYTDGNLIKSQSKLNKFDNVTINISLKDKMNEIMNELSGTFEFHEIPKNSVTVPFIEDADNVLIIRTSYDTTAMVDEEYAKDKINFHRLISNQPFATNIYYKSDTDTSLNIDRLTSLYITDGSTPNYIIKTKTPHTSYVEYPKAYKINSLEDLQILKDSISEMEFIEEFHFHNENFVNDKIGVIRSLDILYGDGSNLDCLHLGSYIMTSAVKYNQWETIYESNGRMSQQSRPLWITKYSQLPKISYILDNDTPIIAADGSLKYPSELLLGDNLKSIGLEWVSPEDVVDENGIPLFLIGVDSGSFTNDLNTFNVSTSSIVDMQQANVETLMVQVTLENGVIYQDLATSAMLIERYDTLVTTFEPTNKFRINDSIVFFDYINNTLTKSKITNLEIVFVTRNVYHLDVASIDVFLPIADMTLGISFIQHNQFCYAWCGIPDCTWSSCDACPFCSNLPPPYKP